MQRDEEDSHQGHRSKVKPDTAAAGRKSQNIWKVLKMRWSAWLYQQKISQKHFTYLVPQPKWFRKCCTLLNVLKFEIFWIFSSTNPRISLSNFAAAIWQLWFSGPTVLHVFDGSLPSHTWLAGPQLVFRLPGVFEQEPELKNTVVFKTIGRHRWSQTSYYTSKSYFILTAKAKSAP